MQRRLVMGIIAHVDSGKTTLSEAVLYNTGRIRKLGRVDKKDAFLDNYALERERGITIFSKQAVFEYDDIEVTLIDTPGHVDFSPEMERSLQILDAAVLVISGPDGVQAHTRTLWRLLRNYDIPTFIFVNKMDRETRRRAQILEELQNKLGEGFVDMSTAQFCDRCDMSTAQFCDRCSLNKLFEHDTLENMAVMSEEALEEFLEFDTLSDDTIRDLVGERKIFPCFFGSALMNRGVCELLHGICAMMPQMYEERSQLSAKVYKIDHDVDGNRLSCMKITGGCLHNRDVIEGKKITQIRIYSGEKYKAVDEVSQGQVCAVMGLDDSYPGMSIGEEEESLLPQLTPVLIYRVADKDYSQMMELLPKLKILEEEEPRLDISWDSELHELQIRIMGEIQLEILKRQLLERFGEKVEFDKGSILYKETVSGPVVGVGHFEPLRHYAEAQLLLEPGAPGSGIEVSSACSTDDLELNWQRLVFTHILEKEHKGVLTGAGLTDVKVTLIAGRSHIKHTEGGDFRQAVYRAIRQGLMRARSEGRTVLLEPWYDFSIELPRSYCGRAMTDIDNRKGRIVSQQETGEDDMIIIFGKAPVFTMQGYAAEVVSYTGGQGSMYMTFGGYLPCHNTEDIMRIKGYDPEADLKNPASSVFCAHGSGFNVPWDEVDNYKHIDCKVDINDRKVTVIRLDTQKDTAEYCPRTTDEPLVSSDEIDAIIEKTFYSNRRSGQHRNAYAKHRQKLEIKTQTTRVNNVQSSNRADLEKYLLVDGYNIIYAWKELRELLDVNIDAARDRLNELLCNYQYAHGMNLIVVYDAYRVQGHDTSVYKLNNINIVFTKEAETADRFIERFAHENAKRYDVTVATSDGLEQIIIRGAGCKLMTATDLAAAVEETNERLKDGCERTVSRIGTEIGSILKKST